MKSSMLQKFWIQGTKGDKHYIKCGENR